MKLKIIYPRATKSAFLYQAFCKPWEFGISKAKMDKYSPWLQNVQPCELDPVYNVEGNLPLTPTIRLYAVRRMMKFYVSPKSNIHSA